LPRWSGLFGSGNGVVCWFGVVGAVWCVGVEGLRDAVNVGAPYACEFEISNTVQDSHNTVTVSQLRDEVFAAVPPPDLVLPINSSTPGLILAGGASCDATKCTIPFGGSVDDVVYFALHGAGGGLPGGCGSGDVHLAELLRRCLGWV
jgi:hypothetical protein